MASEEVPAVGIDLGTTYSCVAVMQNGRVKIIANRFGNRTTPSWVAYRDSETFIGKPARRQVSMNLENTIYDMKRLIGRRFDEPCLQADMKHWPFNVVESKGKPMIKVNYSGREEMVRPEEITSRVLSFMKMTAEIFLGTTIRTAVITVPANFNDSQRKATLEACKISGFNDPHMINEPTAAAIAYGWDKTDADQRTILVFDMGGGTLDVSLINIHDGVYRVKTTAGNNHLGGRDFDNCMVTDLVREFRNKYGKDISKDQYALSRLYRKCEKAKLELSVLESTEITIICLHKNIDFQTTMSRAHFEDLNAHLFQRTLDPVKQVFQDSAMSKDEIDDILLVGGSARIPKIQQILQDFFPGKKFHESISADEAVAYGAAVYSAYLNGDNPGNLKNFVIRDVCPLSLGVNLIGGFFDTAIKRNTVIPVKETVTVVTISDDQKSLSLPVYEGERPMARDNHLLDRIVLTGFPSRPAGKVEFDVTFEIDVNGILTVTAMCKDSDNSASLTITNDKERLSREEIEQMVNDSVLYKEEDDKQRDQKASSRKLFFAIRDIRDAIDDQESKFSTNDREIVRTKCKKALDWRNDNKMADKERFESERKDLRDACKPAFELAGVTFPPNYT